MSRILFSAHALKGALERGIDPARIVNVIEESIETIDVKYTRKAGVKHFDCDYIVVIYETRNGEIVVVTLEPIRKLTI